MRKLIHFVKKALWLPFDMLAYVFGGIPPSYYEDVRYKGKRDSDRFEKNDAECRRKYGMSMLEKIRFEEKKILGGRFKEIEEGCTMSFEPWYRLEIFHDMMCMTEGLFDSLLEKHLVLLRAEYGMDENGECKLQQDQPCHSGKPD